MKISGKKNKNSTVRFLLIGVLGILAIALICVTLYYVHEVKSARNATAALVAEAQEKYGVELSVADLTTEREAILLSVEDPTFWYHKGVDLVTPGAGMTTISQSLVKLLYFPDGFRPGISKIRQTLIAQYAFDDMVSKDDQLSLFLNACYLGHKDGRTIHGFAEASRVYFEKEFKNLSDSEFLALVAMLIAPNSLQPGSIANANRIERIERYLSGEYQPVSVMGYLIGSDGSINIVSRILHRAIDCRLHSLLL